MEEKFTVTFYDDDRETVLDKQEVKKGQKVVYAGKSPEKPIENGMKYVFAGWETNGNLEMVTENLEVFAKYEVDAKSNVQEADLMFDLSEKNAETAKLNEVVQAGQKVSQVEKVTRNLTTEQKKDLVNEIKEKGFVDLDKQVENERD